MTLKFNIDSIEKNTEGFSGTLSFKNEQYDYVLKKENDKKQIQLPYSISRLIPLQNFTTFPRSVLRLLVKCTSTDLTVSDNLFVDRRLYFKKRNETQGNWLSSESGSIQLYSDSFFDFFSENHLLKNIEIYPK